MGYFYDDKDREKDDEFMYGFLMAQEFEDMKREEEKRKAKSQEPIKYTNDYEDNIRYYEKNYENHKKHNLLLDIILISATGGAWFIWMIIRYFKELKEQD